MPLYEMTNAAFLPLNQASFTDMKVRERDDLQRLLRAQIEVLGDDLYVLSEEFSDWDDSRRRIDLLAIDKQANLVVIELKRTNDGGHMELQAIRYASMVSTMTFERAVQVHSEFLGKLPEEAQIRLLTFLCWNEPDEENFAPSVRIVLVSEDFGKELTTSVLWLRDFDIDISCVRLRPYQKGETKLIDVQQIIPLPEANDYQVQLRKKEQVERKNRAERDNLLLHFWEGLVAFARKGSTRHANIKPSGHHWLGASSGVRGLSFTFVVLQEYGHIELYIDRGEAAENKQIFDRLIVQKAEIENAFGAELHWDRLDDKRACRVKYVVNRGGYRSAQSLWPDIQKEMIEKMNRFEMALKSRLADLGL